MKKRKVSFLFNIITISLAVVAIAVGVYSLQKSSLNISGSFGFSAHNVNARIDAYMYGYAIEEKGVPLTESEKVRLTNANGLLIHDSLTDYSLNLGATNGSGSDTRYFSNLGTSGKMEDIVVEITVSNTSGGSLSPKNILANVDFANCTSSLTDKIRIDCDKSAAVLEITNGKTQATFTFKISLLPDSTGSYGATTLTNVGLKINLEETTYTQSQVRTDATIKQFTSEYVNNLRSTLNNLKIQYDYEEYLEYNDTIKCYAERYPYYVEMGERDNEKVKWLIVGTFANDIVTALVDSDKTQLSQGYMLKDTTYVMLSEKVLYSESTTNYGISFQNNYTHGLTTTPDCKNSSGYSAQDYATSNIRNYLKGVDVHRSYKSGTTYEPDENPTINLLTDYNLKSDPLYAKIQGRTLTSLYANIGTPKGTIWTSSDSRDEVNLQPTTQDKLWLLSETEMTKIFAGDLLGSSYRASAITTTHGTVSSTDGWWLRMLSDFPYADYVLSMSRSGGFLENNSACDYYFGTRPAFLF